MLKSSTPMNTDCPICGATPSFKAFVIGEGGKVVDLGASVYADGVYTYPLEHTKVVDDNVLGHLDEMANDLADDVFGAGCWVPKALSGLSGHHFAVRIRKV